MIAITKEEKNVIASRYPKVHIVRTMRQKSKRHKYYCVETKAVLKLLEEMRPDFNAKKRGDRNTTDQV